MTVSVTTLDRRPSKSSDADGVFGPQRFRDIKHSDGESFLATTDGVLYVLPQAPSDAARLASDPGQVLRAVAVYPAGHWFGASRR